MKVLFSSKRKPFQCPSCGQYGELPTGQRKVFQVLTAVLMVSLYGQGTLETLWGDSAIGVILLSIATLFFYVMFACHLLALDQETMRARSTLQISWFLGGKVTPLKFALAALVVPAWILIRARFYTHVPLIQVTPTALIYLLVMAILGWQKFYR